MGPADHLEHDLVPVLAGLRAAADHGEVERGQVPGPGRRPGSGTAPVPAPASSSVSSVTSAAPLTTPQTSWNPSARRSSQATRPMCPAHRGPRPPGRPGRPIGPVPSCHPGLLGQQALAGQAAGVVRGLEVRMDQRGARGRQVIGVDRTPHGRGVQAPHQLGMADHDGQGVPDEGRRQVVQVEEVTPGIVDADRAVRGVRHDVGHDHGLPLADAALGRELGGKRDGGRSRTRCRTGRRLAWP